MNIYNTVKMALTMMYGASTIRALVRLCSGGRSVTTNFSGPLPSAACDRPMKPTSSNGPMTSSVRYSATRRAKLRGCSTRHRKLKLSSTFLIVPSKVQASNANPRVPTTPLLTRSANCMTFEVSSSAAWPPTGRKNSKTIGCRSRCAPNIFRMAKLNASSGISDSRVV